MAFDGDEAGLDKKERSSLVSAIQNLLDSQGRGQVGFLSFSPHLFLSIGYHLFFCSMPVSFSLSPPLTPPLLLPSVSSIELSSLPVHHLVPLSSFPPAQFPLGCRGRELFRR